MKLQDLRQISMSERKYVAKIESAITGIVRRTSWKGSNPVKPAIAMATPATGLEERAMPDTNCRGGHHEGRLSSDGSRCVRNHRRKAEERGIAGTRHKSRPHDDEEHHRKDCHRPGIHCRHGLNDGRNAARLHQARSEDFRRHDEKYR